MLDWWKGSWSGQDSLQLAGRSGSGCSLGGQGTLRVLARMPLASNPLLIKTVEAGS